MIILWSLLLITAASAHKVVESTEDIGPEAFANVTTLYPVANASAISNNNNNDDKTTENNKTNNTSNGNSEFKEEKPKTEATAWKIEAAFAESNLDKGENATVFQKGFKNETKEFRPSQHLGSFVDLEDATPTRPAYDSFTPVIKQTASGFVNSKEEYRSNNKIPKELLSTHKEYPYKFESSIFTRAKDSWRPDRHKPWPQGTPGLEGLGNRPGKGWGGNPSLDSFGERPGKNWGSSGFDGNRPGKGWDASTGLGGFGDQPKGWGLDSLEAKPTEETSIRVPAGGLYKYPDSFKEKPGIQDEDFGLDFNNGEKEHAVKKHNPWEGILRMLTAFIPVGLIISALTPSILTIESTGPGPVTGNTYPSNLYRRSDELEDLPVISERCRRRLLCELHSEANYTHQQNSVPRKRKQCHRIRCEDAAALARTLRWLLDRQTDRHYT